LIRHITALLIPFGLLLSIAGCDTTDPCGRPALIRTTTSPLIICQQQAEFQIDLMLENKGCEDLQITGAEFQGADKDAFSTPELAPGSDTIPPESQGFVRFTYAPPTVGEDHVWLVIQSNAGNFSKYVIPICGPGAVAGDAAQACIETTQCDDGLSCMRSNENSVLLDCEPNDADGEDENCFCQARQCMSNCRCPEGLPADAECVDLQ
jgi:hypothetical protein